MILNRKIFIVLIILFYSCFFIKKKPDYTVIKGSYEIINTYDSNSKNISKIEGYVYDKVTNKKLSYGFIYCKGDSTSFTRIDSNAHFELNLIPKSYDFIIKMVGNTDLELVNISLDSGKIIEIKILLGTIYIN